MTLETHHTLSALQQISGADCEKLAGEHTGAATEPDISLRSR